MQKQGTVVPCGQHYDAWQDSERKVAFELGLEWVAEKTGGWVVGGGELGKWRLFLEKTHKPGSEGLFQVRFRQAPLGDVGEI